MGVAFVTLRLVLLSKTQEVCVQITSSLITTVKAWTLKAGLGGFDINKKGTKMGEEKM